MKIAMSGILAEFSLEQLTKEAELIVEAHVTAPAIESAVVSLGPTDFRLAFTDNKVRVDNVLKAPPTQTPREILVRTLGGVTAEFEVSVDNEARLSQREDVVLFLSRDFPVPLPPNVFTVMGGYQGKFSVFGTSQARFVARMQAEKELELTNLRRTIQEHLGYKQLAATRW